MSVQHYDYIIAGAGCAGLSLAVHLLRSKGLQSKKVLIIDRVTKSENDRTWCFWEQESDLFQPIVYREWTDLVFKNNSFFKDLQIAPYSYKMVRGIDFYQYCLKIIADAPNFTFLSANIEELFSTNATGVIADGIKYTAQFVFNSLVKVPQSKSNQYWLLQHFKGFVINTPKPAFDPNVATLMDFTTNQHHGTTFFYVLPFSENEALVEYTIFSKKALADAEYESALHNYITNDLRISDYQVTSVETGSIPMTNYRFPKGNGNIINIGTAGGQTKGSSGYTFKFIQKHSALITRNLEGGMHPIKSQPNSHRHQFYDSVLLQILNNKSLGGDFIFTEMFRRNPAAKILKFLDNETEFLEELRIISSLPIFPFAKAALQQLIP